MQIKSTIFIMCDLTKKFMAAASCYFHLTKLTLQHVNNITNCITICMLCLGVVYVPYDGALLLLCKSIGYTKITWIKFKTILNKVVCEEVVSQQLSLVAPHNALFSTR